MLDHVDTRPLMMADRREVLDLVRAEPPARGLDALPMLEAMTDTDHDVFYFYFRLAQALAFKRDKRRAHHRRNVLADAARNLDRARASLSPECFELCSYAYDLVAKKVLPRPRRKGANVGIFGVVPTGTA